MFLLKILRSDVINSIWKWQLMLFVFSEGFYYALCFVLSIDTTTMWRRYHFIFYNCGHHSFEKWNHLTVKLLRSEPGMVQLQSPDSVPRVFTVMTLSSEFLSMWSALLTWHYSHFLVWLFNVSCVLTLSLKCRE